VSAPFRLRFRLRDKLLAAVTLLVVVLTLAILLILNARLQSESSNALDSDLDRTFSIFSSFVSQETGSLRDKAVLMAGLPRLTAALDVRKPKFSTMADTVSELCLDLSSSVKAPPLFVVTDKEGRVLFDSHHPPEEIVALRAGRDPDPAKMRSNEQPVMANNWPNVKAALQGQPSQGGFLYQETQAGGKTQVTAYQTVTYPILSHGENLGVIVLGVALDKPLAENIKKLTDSEVAFLIGKDVTASTWPEDKYSLVAQTLSPMIPSAEMWKEKETSPPAPVNLNNENYRVRFAAFMDPQGQLLGSYAILRSADKALALQKNLQQTIVIIGILGVVFAVGMAFFIARRITNPLNSLLLGVQEIGRGNLNAQVPLETHDELGVLAQSFNEMIQGLREKERVTNILGKYISPEVAKKVLSSGEGMALKGERRECVVMFTDIRGFTAFSENMAPEKIVADLNEYFSLMVDVVIKYEGTLDKFIGDAIMAVWGAPVPFEDKELRGVKAALEMQRALGQYNKARIDKNQTPLTMGIGLNSGVVVSGNLGSDKRTDYTVIGEEVNLASRLCSKAAPGQVLISEGMYRKLKGLVEVRPLDPIALKGFSEPVKVYEVTSLTGAA
jgi:class 3 adenylate cyclase